MVTTRPKALAAALVLVLLAGCRRPTDETEGTADEQTEEQAVRAIEALGGDVTRDDEEEGTPVVGVELCNPKVTDAALKEPPGTEGAEPGGHPGDGRGREGTQGTP
jgi:hypothetical protein